MLVLLLLVLLVRLLLIRLRLVLLLLLLLVRLLLLVLSLASTTTDVDVADERLLDALSAVRDLREHAEITTRTRVRTGRERFKFELPRPFVYEP